MLPTHSDLYTLTTNAAGHPVGVRRRWQWIRQKASQSDAKKVAEALVGDIEISQTVGVLAVISEMNPSCGPGRQALIGALVEGLEDERTLEWAWGPKGYQTKSFPVAELTAGALIALIRRRRCVRSDASGQVARHDALVAALTVALGNRVGARAVRALVRGADQGLVGTDRGHGVVRRLAELLEAAATDPRRPAELRWMALEELAVAAREIDRPTTRGMGRGAPPHERQAASRGSIFASASRRAVDAMTEVLSDEATDLFFRRLAWRRLSRVAPEDVERIQRAGHLPVIGLPEPEEVITSWGRPNDETVEALVSRLPTEVVRAALVAPGCVEPRACLAAASIAPALASRVGWRAVAGWLLTATRCREGVAIPRSRASSPLRIDVGAFCLDRLVRVTARQLRDRDAVLTLVVGALDPLLDAHAGRDRDFKTAFERLLAVVAGGGFSEQDKLAVSTALRSCAADPKRSAPARFAALKALEAAGGAALLATEILLDRAEVPALRASVGATIERWNPKTVGRWVDVSVEPWRLIAGAPRDLPIAEPRRRVPIEWLVASLEASDDPKVVHGCVREIGSRLNLRQPSSVEWVDRVTSLLGDASRARLRQTLAHAADRGYPRWSAAIVLAMLGQPDDEHLLVDFAVERGTWTRRDVTEAELDTGNLLEHMTLDPLSYEAPKHLLEPYLRAGYGDDHADRMMSRVFVRLGETARIHGYLHKARHAYRMAYRLDPLSLVARRHGGQ